MPERLCGPLWAALRTVSGTPWVDRTCYRIAITAATSSQAMCQA